MLFSFFISLTKKYLIHNPRVHFLPVLWVLSGSIIAKNLFFQVNHIRFGSVYESKLWVSDHAISRRKSSVHSSLFNKRNDLMPHIKYRIYSFERRPRISAAFEINFFKRAPPPNERRTSYFQMRRLVNRGQVIGTFSDILFISLLKVLVIIHK